MNKYSGLSHANLAGIAPGAIRTMTEQRNEWIKDIGTCDLHHSDEDAQYSGANKQPPPLSWP